MGVYISFWRKRTYLFKNSLIVFVKNGINNVVDIADIVVLTFVKNAAIAAFI